MIPKKADAVVSPPMTTPAPVVVTALYNTGVNTGTLALLLLIPFLAVLLYVANKWAQEWMRRVGSDA